MTAWAAVVVPVVCCCPVYQDSAVDFSAAPPVDFVDPVDSVVGYSSPAADPGFVSDPFVIAAAVVVPAAVAAAAVVAAAVVAAAAVVVVVVAAAVVVAAGLGLSFGPFYSADFFAAVVAAVLDASSTAQSSS